MSLQPCLPHVSYIWVSNILGLTPKGAPTPTVSQRFGSGQKGSTGVACCYLPPHPTPPKSVSTVLISGAAREVHLPGEAKPRGWGSLPFQQGREFLSGAPRWWIRPRPVRSLFSEGGGQTCLVAASRFPPGCAQAEPISRCCTLSSLTQPSILIIMCMNSFQKKDLPGERLPVASLMGFLGISHLGPLMVSFLVLSSFPLRRGWASSGRLALACLLMLLFLVLSLFPFRGWGSSEKSCTGAEGPDRYLSSRSTGFLRELPYYATA